MHFYIITVIYNQLVIDSAIYSNIDLSLPVTLIFVDNSSKEDFVNKNQDFCLRNNFIFLRMNGNQGLPKAYNRAIAEIPKDCNSWIIICDQDTEVTTDFLQYYKKSIELNSDMKIFCPIIKDTVGIMSPSELKDKKYIHSKITDFNRNIERFSFINSCMCINSTVFEFVKYDEKLFLDCVDHDFVKTIRKVFSDNLFYVISDLEVFQNFSGATKNSLESDVNRFRIYLKDTRYFYNKWYKTEMCANIYLLFRAMKLSLTHKTFVFLKMFLNTKHKTSCR